MANESAGNHTAAVVSSAGSVSEMRHKAYRKSSAAWRKRRQPQPGSEAAALPQRRKAAYQLRMVAGWRRKLKISAGELAKAAAAAAAAAAAKAL